MRIFAAALNVFALTSAVKLEALTEATFTNAKIDKTTEGYKVITGEVAYIWDGCQAVDGGIAACMVGKLTGDLAMPEDAAKAMTKGLDAAVAEGTSKAELKTQFQDVIFGLY